MSDHDLPDGPDTDGQDADGPDAASALNLRLLLALFGIAVCGPGALVAFLVGGGVGIVLGLLLLAGAVVAGVDLVVVQRRRRERAEAERDAHGAPLSHSLFE